MADWTILETKRLALRTWDEEDLDTVFALHAHADITRYLPGGLPWTREKAAERLAGWIEHYETHGVSKLKLMRRDDETFVGRAGFSLMDELDEFELGYTIAPDFQGRGYATEIADALARAFLRSGMRDRFIAIAHVDNAASLKVMEKIGMRYERTGFFYDAPCRVYAMSAQDLSG